MADTTSSVLFGGGIFHLLTTGLYDTPLAMYREYIQNASDAIQTSRDNISGKVEINVNPVNRSIVIRDNGPGLSPQDAKRNLVVVSQSHKRRGMDRGFRGVGRLSALAFADAVVFRTRSSANQNIVEVAWDGNALRMYATQNSLSPDQVIENCVQISEINGTGWPDHFFEVEVKNVARHAAGEILNRDAVRSYISEVCPVPMNPNFPFADEVTRLFQGRGFSLFSLNILLEEEESPIMRPLGHTVGITDERECPFTEFERFIISEVDSANPAAIGWLAHTDYFGAIPKGLSIRGLRVREGNLQIGDEKAFDHIFPEERFNRWCVGEVHVIDSRLFPNGRRDYFEPGPHIRNLENQLEAIARNISSRCRNAAARRNNMRKLLMELEQTEAIYKLASTGYLTTTDARKLVQDTLTQIKELRSKSSGFSEWSSSEQVRLNKLEKKLKDFRPKSNNSAFSKMQESEIKIYQNVFSVLAKTSTSSKAAMKTIEEVLMAV